MSRPGLLSRPLLAVLLPAVLLAAGSCGVPDDDQVRSIDPSTVPYGLLSPGRSPSGAPGDTDDAAAGPRLYWTDASDHLVARPPAAYCVRSTAALVAAILDQLTAGPPQPDRVAGLGTAMPPQRWVDLVDLHHRTATLRVADTSTLDPARVALATGQVVLAVTSVAGVDRVAVEHGTETLQAPLPDGRLASGAVGADDYAALLSDPAEPRTRAAHSRQAPLCPEHGL